MGNCIAIIYTSPILTSILARILMKEPLGVQYPFQAGKKRDQDIENAMPVDNHIFCHQESSKQLQIYKVLHLIKSCFTSHTHTHMKS